MIGENLGWPVLVLGDNRCTPLNAGRALPEADRKAHFSTSRGLWVRRLMRVPVALKPDLWKQLAQYLMRKQAVGAGGHVVRA